GVQCRIVYGGDGPGRVVRETLDQRAHDRTVQRQEPRTCLERRSHGGRRAADGEDGRVDVAACERGGGFGKGQVCRRDVRVRELVRIEELARELFGAAALGPDTDTQAAQIADVARGDTGRHEDVREVRVERRDDAQRGRGAVEAGPAPVGLVHGRADRE